MGRPKGFGGLKAPAKTDFIDKLLLGDDHEAESGVDSESLCNDGKPAQIGLHGIARLQSEQNLGNNYSTE